MPAILSTILALAKAIPIIDSWIQKLIVEYTNSRIDSMKKEDIDAIKYAIEKQDQREIEIILGSKKAGELSGEAGTVIVDHLPGVK